MISSVSCKNLKGLEFTTTLSKLTILVGPNGIGKTARSDALQLTLLGYHPKAGKKNADIYGAFGDGTNPLYVGATLSDNTHLLRRYTYKKGSVAQDYMVDRKKATRDQFVIAAAKHRILDLAAFMELSDQKKTDLLFALFPPDGDIRDLDTKIEALKEKQNKTEEKARTLGSTIERLLGAKAQIELPSGTQAETRTQIAKLEGELSTARQELEAARIERARVEAEEKAKADADAKAEADKAKWREDMRREMEKERAEKEAAPTIVSDPVPQDIPRQAVSMRPEPAATAPLSMATAKVFVDEISSLMPASQPAVHRVNTQCADSIQAILASLERTGCTACAARLVCKRELKKFQGGDHV